MLVDKYVAGYVRIRKSMWNRGEWRVTTTNRFKTRSDCCMEGWKEQKSNNKNRDTLIRTEMPLDATLTEGTPLDTNTGPLTLTQKAAEWEHCSGNRRRCLKRSVRTDRECAALTSTTRATKSTRTKKSGEFLTAYDNQAMSVHRLNLHIRICMVSPVHCRHWP